MISFLKDKFRKDKSCKIKQTLGFTNKKKVVKIKESRISQMNKVAKFYKN
jgi:uncharacterized protein YggU (UPF0235/DUF167 family)